MKKIITTFASVLISGFLFAQDISLLDNDHAFLGIRFNQDKDSLARIIAPAPTSGDEKEQIEVYRVIKKQFYQFGTCPFKEFNLSFWNNKVDMMLIDVTPENATKLLEELESVYGKATKPNPRNEIYVWQGKRVFMQYVKVGGAASLTISSNVVKKAKEEWKKKKFEKMIDSY